MSDPVSETDSATQTQTADDIETVEPGGVVEQSEAADSAVPDDVTWQDEPTDESEGLPSADAERLEREGDLAADFLEELLDIADLDGDIDMDVEGDRAAVSIVGGSLDHLIGRNGEVLNALQELTRLAVHRETGERSRLMLDIGGFRASRRRELEGVAADAIEQVRSSGEAVALKPMSPFERKVVHDVVAEAGLVSESEGADRQRHVVISPA